MREWVEVEGAASSGGGKGWVEVDGAQWVDKQIVWTELGWEICKTDGRRVWDELVPLDDLVVKVRVGVAQREGVEGKPLDG